MASQAHRLATSLMAVVAGYSHSMMDLPELLEPSRISCRNSIASKKRTLQILSELLGSAIDDEELSEMDILDALIVRERLGSTALGHGVALPHSRMSQVDKPFAALVTLEEGVDFEAIDNQPVDIALGLLVPENCNDEHLAILAHLATRFDNADFRDQLRNFAAADDLFTYLQNLPPLTT